MKTREEIDEMFRQYESKWGKLGHTSILHPERNKEEKTMSIMDNELYKFRQKVFNGKEANKVSHKSMVNITELNRQYFEKVTTDGTLIHAQNPLYGQQNPNAKYYKREGQPGKYRYYYTKEEWDAAHKQDNAQTEANREAQERQQYENNKKAANNNVLNRFNNMRADVVNEYAKIAREGSAKDAAKAFYDMGKGGNEAIDELYSAIQEGFKSGKLSYKDGRFETDDDQLKDDIEAFSDNIQKFARQIGEASGKGREIQNELEKLMLPDIEAMSKKAEARKDNSRKQELAKSNKANRLDNGENVKTNETNFSEDKEKGEKLITGDSKEAQEMRIAYNDLWDESWKDDYDHSNYQEGANRQFKSLYKTAKLLEMYGINPSNDLKNAYSYIKPNSKEGQNIIKEADKEFEEFMKSHKHLEKYFSNKEVKHSSISNSYFGDEIVDEYKAFQEKVKKGKEKNRLAHTATISPAMLNARYEEELNKKGILIHQANYKYYNKIDLGNGQSRYFYTKAEWDAYQREKGSKTNTNQKLSADTLKQIEQQKQKKEAYDKNAEAAKHEGDRYQKKEEPKVTVESIVVDVKKDPNFTKTVNTVKAAIDNGDISYVYDKPIVNIDKKTGKPSEAGMKADEAWKNLYKSFNDLSSKNKENGLSYEDVKGALMNAFNSELKKAQSSNKSGSDDKPKDSNPGNLGFDKMKEGMTQEEFDKALKDAKDSIDFDKMTNEISEVINDQFKNMDQSILDGIKDQVAKETEKMLKNKFGF